MTVVVRDMNNIVAARDSEDEKRIFFFEAELKLIGWFESLPAAAMPYSNLKKFQNKINVINFERRTPKNFD